jgi:hypothetical protein
MSTYIILGFFLVMFGVGVDLILAAILMLME